MMRIMAIANQKGGCGKTTTAINLSACLAYHKKKVLLIDLDPQGHSTIGFHVTNREMNSIYDLLCPENGQSPSIEETIVSISDCLDLIPADVILSAAEHKLAGKEGREYRLRSVLSSLSRTYDFIILDCPPNIGLLTFNAFLAATEVIIPIDISFFSLHGLGKLLETLHLINKKCRHTLTINALVTSYDKRIRLSQEIVEEIKRYFQEHIFQSIIRNNVKLKEAISFGKPITEYHQACSGYHDYMALAGEVLEGKYLHHQDHSMDKKENSPKRVKEGVLFSFYSLEALSVYLTGDFNNWANHAEPLFNISGNGLWQKIVPIEAGTHQYKFIVDGNWQLDPANPKTISGPLGNNSLLEFD